MSGVFDSLRRAPDEHFRLCFYGAVLHLRERLHEVPDAADRLPFLTGYFGELDSTGLDLPGWEAAVAKWERPAAGDLPLARLRRAAGLGGRELTLLFVAGLVEEDARFGHVFDLLQGGGGATRPTLGLLAGVQGIGEPEAARGALRSLVELGLLEAGDPDAPRSERTARVPPALWDALRGELAAQSVPGVTYLRPDELVAGARLIASARIADLIDTLPGAVANGAVGALVVRGPRAAGRRTLVGAIARALGGGLLSVDGTADGFRERWALAGPLASLLDAVPVAVVDSPPGASAEIPRLRAYGGLTAIVAGRTGGLEGAGVERVVEVELPAPDAGERALHWEAALEGAAGAEPSELARSFRMTGGNIRRAGRLARAACAAEGRSELAASDVARGRRALHRQALETLAARVPVDGGWTDLAVGDETMHELELLETRCRYRERLRADAGSAPGEALGAGVRALFTGPSGMGKTLAAGLLASTLGLDLYRLDLATVVNKYLGETEKNLARVLARAEELDVVLLLDEGDSLMTRRTSVQSSNDRYANLETNFLLQRLESYEGILVVTTNAGERIDAAFQRRIDMVIEFRAPEPRERWRIWRLHLPEDHLVAEHDVEELAARCSLSGGQIRNAVLHARLLALQDGGIVLHEHAIQGVRREYRKAGQICPLPDPNSIGA